MNLLRRLLHTRLVKTLAVIVVLILAWQVYLAITGPAKIDADLAAQVAEGQPLQVAVSLGFRPERFHTLYMQDYGRVSRVDGNNIVLRDVRPESVRLLSRVYWVDRLSLPETRT